MSHHSGNAKPANTSGVHVHDHGLRTVTLSLSEAHHIAHDAEHALTHAVPKLATAPIHAYPAGQYSRFRETAEVA
jgi:divalent metal cation (Fe/Co/Zn/Cd) transporter